MKRQIVRQCIALAAGLSLLVPAVQAADTYQHGTISDTTSTSAGLMIRIDSGPPGNCASSPYGWMLIKSEHKAMLALTLLMLATGKKSFVVYTAGIGSSGYCEVSQMDPYEV